MRSEDHARERTITRRGFIAAGGAGLVGAYRLVGHPQVVEAAAQTGARPNILCVVSEDCGAYHLGPYGGPVHTPALDRLAHESVRYANAFSPAPVCAPSRFGLITGLEATSCGPAQNQRASGLIPAWLRGFPAFLRDAGYYCTNSGKEDYNAPIDVDDTWDESSAKAHWRNRPAGESFFSVFNFNVTHESSVQLWNVGSLPDTDPASVSLPAYQPDSPQMRLDRAVYYDKIARMDEQIGSRLAELEADGLADDTIVFYYSDHGGVLPRSKHYCYDEGHHIPLMVRFPQRFAHLAPAGPGVTIDDPVSSMDLPPTIMSLAGLDVPGYMQGHVLAGSEPEEPREYAFSFRNRMDECYDMTRTARGKRYRYLRNYMPYVTYGDYNGYMFRQLSYEEWRRLCREGRLDDAQAAFWREKPAEELYDLQIDPDQVNNLAEDDRYRRVLDRMSKALDAHMLEVNDNGFIPEGSPLEGYEQSRRPGAYPLEEVLRVADVAIERKDPGAVPRLLEWMGHDNEVVRYWAVLGCAMRRGAATQALQGLARRLADDAPSVRVVAAEAVCWLGDSDRGLAVLTAALDDEDNRIRLQAANALRHLGSLAAPALTAMERSKSDPDKEVARSVSHTSLLLTGQYPFLPGNVDGLSIEVPDTLPAGKPATVTVTLDDAPWPRKTDVRLSLRAPHAWNVEPTSDTAFGVQPAARPVRATFEVTVPENAEPAGYVLVAEGAFNSGGQAITTREDATVAVPPYVSLAPVFNDVGITDAVGGTLGTLNGQRDSFAAEALADQGLTPGTKVRHGGISFTWPDVAAGFSTNVRCRRQVVELHGPATKLGFLGFSVSGTRSGTGEVHYADGTKETFSVTLTDWRRDQPEAGNERVVHTDYTYRRLQRQASGGNVFFASVPLDGDRDVVTVVLPDSVDMHLFAIGIADD